MTAAELAALKALADAATPGPWEAGEYNRVTADGRHILKCRDQYDGVRLAIHDNAIADAAFIAAARDAVPELIAEVDRLRTELAQAQAQAENERARRKHDSTDAYNARINAAVRQMEYYCK